MRNNRVTHPKTNKIMTDFDFILIMGENGSLIERKIVPATTAAAKYEELLRRFTENRKRPYMYEDDGTRSLSLNATYISLDGFMEQGEYIRYDRV